MKLNISYPATGCQKLVDIDDDNKLRSFYDKRIAQEVEGDVLGDDFRGYIFKISGGNDKQGFPMKQGVLTAGRVRILMREGVSCYRQRKRGERKKKSVRGCIVSAELSILNLVVVKKGDNEIPGLTDTEKPRRLGPKRASSIRKLFNLTKEDDVRKFVIRREIAKEGKKPYTKAPKIQRLVTPQRLQHRRQRVAIKKQRFEKSRQEAETYNTLLGERLKEAKEKRAERIAKKRSQSRLESSAAPAGKKEAPAAAAAAPAGKKTTSAAPAGKSKKEVASAPPAAAPAGKKEAGKKEVAAPAGKAAAPAPAPAPAGKKAKADAPPAAPAGKKEPSQKAQPKEKSAKDAPEKKDAPKKKK